MQKRGHQASRRSTRKSITITGILKQPNARNAFENLVRDGVDTDELEQALLMIPRLSHKKQPLVEGFSDRSLSRFPNRLKSFSTQVERTNECLDPLHITRWKAPLLSPELEPVRTWVHDGTREQKVSMFKILPLILRDYADYLSLILGLPKKVGTRRYTQQKLWTIRLVQIVEKASGQPHYSEVSTLLNAVYAAAGIDLTVDPANLKSFYHRNFGARALALFITGKVSRTSG